ncbi:MAG TPA: DUF305 domain-containing protein [Terriglobales bacterium]|nr:DUF305 domain-containing protein [Terriglobales bacterium]
MKYTVRVTLSAVVFLLSLSLTGSPEDLSQRSNIAGDAEWPELVESMHRMHAGMVKVTSSGDNDIDFVMLMLPHHQAAIEMATAQLLHGTDPQMRRLAQEIIADQQSEIELMQLWLKQHRPVSSQAK